MDNIVLVALGVIFILIGIMNTKGNISMLHSYHRKRVSEEDRIPFGRTVGVGMIIIGIALILTGGLYFAASCLQENVYYIIGTVVLVIGLAAGLGVSFYAMIKYNKGIF